MNYFRVFKFGGSSLGSPNSIKKVKEIIKNEINNTQEKLVVVLSAVYGITNLLFEICEVLEKNETIENFLYTFKEKFLFIIDNLISNNQLNNDCKSFLQGTIDTIASVRNESSNITKREERIIVAQGEILTSYIFHKFLLQENIDNELISALDFMKINEEREPDYNYIQEMLYKLIGNKKLYITQGYICRDHLGNVDNLGRGGSDYSASIIGYVLNSREIQIWSDVSGMYNNDPRFVNNTYPLNYLTFEEAAELAYFGAKVLHPSTVLPAQKKSIPVILKNTFNPQAAGTVITNLILSEGFKAVAAKDNITIIQIKSYGMLMAYGFLRKIFEVFERYKVSVDVITTSEVSVSLTVDDDSNLEEIVNELSSFSSVEIIKNNTIIACVGYIPKNKSGYLRKVMSLIEEIPVRMLSYGSSDYSITLVIDTNYKIDALNKLNRLFI